MAYFTIKGEENIPNRGEHHMKGDRYHRKFLVGFRIKYVGIYDGLDVWSASPTHITHFERKLAESEFTPYVSVKRIPIDEFVEMSIGRGW